MSSVGQLTPQITLTGTPTSLEASLDALHQMLYRRGGVRPVNAAIEELAKVLLLQIAHSRTPDLAVEQWGKLSMILQPSRIRAEDSVDAVKEAFREIIRQPEYAGRLPTGSLQPIWPLDEPLRIQRADVLAEALEILHVEALSRTGEATIDPLGTAFDTFLQGRYDHGGGLGTYLTPHTVAVHLAQLVLEQANVTIDADNSGPVVGDPCCGTGRFLVAALEVLAARTDMGVCDNAFGNSLFGADQSTSAVAKARVNLLLYGVSHPNVFAVKDSITDQAVDRLRGQLRVILTNPPFGDAKYDSPEGINRTRRLLAIAETRRQIDPALAFVARCVDLLADGGLAAIILPDGLVDGKTLRSALVHHSETRPSEISVEAAISLPSQTFALAGTTAKTSALILRRGSRRSDFVFFARADHVGFKKQGGRKVLDAEGDDLPAIAATYARTRKIRRGSDDVELLSADPLTAAVMRNEVRYLSVAWLDPRAIDARARIKAQGGVPLSNYLTAVQRSSPEPPVPFISVLHVDPLGSVNWQAALDYQPTTPGRAALSGDVLVSRINPRHLRATVVPDDVECVWCSSEFGVFEAQRVDPYAVLALLHHEDVHAQFAPLGRGTSSSRRRINDDELLSTLVPRLSAKRSSVVAERVRNALVTIREGNALAVSAYDEVT